MIVCNDNKQPPDLFCTPMCRLYADHTHTRPYAGYIPNARRLLPSSPAASVTVPAASVASSPFAAAAEPAAAQPATAVASAGGWPVELAVAPASLCCGRVAAWATVEAGRSVR